VKCTMCGYQFEQKAGQSACKNCPMAGGCGDLVCCPNCGFELPVEPKWIRKVINFIRGNKNAAD
jgi:rubredoxin